MIQKEETVAGVKTSSKYTEDWLPVKQIMNGMIQLDNGYYVTGIKVSPKNIFILDKGTQDAIIFNLRNFYNMIDYEFWLVVADRPVDINIYLSQLQLLEIIQKRIHNLISALANCSINSTQVSNADLRMILDNFLNGGNKSTLGTVIPV